MEKKGRGTFEFLEVLVQSKDYVKKSINPILSYFAPILAKSGLKDVCRI